MSDENPGIENLRYYQADLRRLRAALVERDTQIASLKAARRLVDGLKRLIAEYEAEVGEDL